MSADRNSLPLIHRGVGDLEPAAQAAEHAVRVWGLDGSVDLVRLSMNAVFRCGDVIVRVGRPTDAAALTLLPELLREIGISVPGSVGLDPVRVGTLTVSAQRFEASSGRAVDWRTVGVMLRRLHDRLDPSALPGVIPLADPRLIPWWDFPMLIKSVEQSPLIGVRERAALSAVVEQNASWGDLILGDQRVCHGDLQPGNVIQTAQGPVLLDWDLLGLAPVSWDHGPLLGQAIGPWPVEASVYAAFAEGYGRDLSADPSALTFARLRDLAATLMRVKAAMERPALADEARLRLEYWVEGSAGRTWTPQ
ncbi:MAG: phosphotransferase [Ilumatobacteraceae bacterium]